MSDKIESAGRQWSPEALKRYREYQAEFNKETYKSYLFKFSRMNDADVIAMLNQQANIADYVRSLIRKDMAEKGIQVDELDRMKQELGRKPGRPRKNKKVEE